MYKVFPTFVFFVLLATPALAADRLTQQNRDAKKACLTGDYRKGLEILADLFIETDDPIHIFNQGRCLEQSHQWQEAIDRFREYLRKSPHLEAGYVADTNNHIADCENFLEKEQGKLSPPPVQPQPKITTAEPVQPTPPDPSASPGIVTTTEPMTASGTGLRTAGWILAATGIVAVATGVALNLKANSVANELWNQQSQSKQSQHETLKTWSWVSYGAGASLVATGVGLYLLGMKAGNASKPVQVSLLPAADFDRATLNLFGVF